MIIDEILTVASPLITDCRPLITCDNQLTTTLPDAEFTRIIPDPSLQPVIDSYWIIRYEVISGGVLPMLPMGYPFLEFNLGDSWIVRHRDRNTTRFRHILVGLTTSPLYLENISCVHSILVRLQPWGLASLFREAAHLNDCHSPDLVLEDSMETLVEALRAARSETSCKALLDHFFIAHLGRINTPVDQRLQYAVNVILQRKGQLVIADLEREVFLSQRRLEQLFRDQLGLSPKTYADIARFQSVLAADGQYATLGQLAQEAGYYDQSHFIRQFKKLSGRRPSDLLRQTDRPVPKISNLYNAAS